MLGRTNADRRRIPGSEAVEHRLRVLHGALRLVDTASRLHPAPIERITILRVPRRIVLDASELCLQLRDALDCTVGVLARGGPLALQRVVLALGLRER